MRHHLFRWPHTYIRERPRQSMLFTTPDWCYMLQTSILHIYSDKTLWYLYQNIKRNEYWYIKPKKNNECSVKHNWMHCFFSPVSVHLLRLCFPPCLWSKASLSVCLSPRLSYPKSLPHTLSHWALCMQVCVPECARMCMWQGVQWVIITACRPVWLITYCQPFFFCRACNAH